MSKIGKLVIAIATDAINVQITGKEIDVYLYDFNKTLVTDSNNKAVAIVGRYDYVSNYTVDKMDDFIEEVLNSGEA